MSRNPDIEGLNRESIWLKKFGRRRLLAGTIAIPGIAAEAYILSKRIFGFAEERAISPIAEQYNAYKRAEVPDVQFLKENERLKNIKLGCSFSPEKFFEIQGNEDHAKALKALKYVVEDLHVKDIRLGIRWSNVTDKKGNFNFEYYQRYFDYCLENGINICLGVGPFKTFRWPEVHLPKEVLETFGKLLPKKYEIKPTDPIAQKAFSYLNTLLFYLRTHYTPEQLESLKSIQAENEPFYPFGDLEWTSSPDYLKKVIQTIKFHFPEKQVLVNSAGTFDLENIHNLFKELIENGVISADKLIAGFDYYNQVEDASKKIEEIIKQALDKVEFVSRIKDQLIKGVVNTINWFDIISASQMAPNEFGDINILEKLRNLGIKIEVTEAQAEKWGRYTSPGDSVTNFKFVILRCLDVLDPKPDSKENSILRIWGIENLVWLHLFGKPSQEQKKMLGLIPAVNLLS